MLLGQLQRVLKECTKMLGINVSLWNKQLNSSPLIYATWNPADKSTNISLSGGNLIATTTAFGDGLVRATIGKVSGKWYWEITTQTAMATFAALGAGSTAVGPQIGSPGTGDSIGYRGYDGAVSKNSVLLGNNAIYSIGVTLGLALDMDAGTLTMYKAGIVQPIVATGITGTYYPMVGGLTSNTETFVANFGASAFTYTPPSGYNFGLYN